MGEWTFNGGTEISQVSLKISSLKCVTLDLENTSNYYFIVFLQTFYLSPLI